MLVWGAVLGEDFSGAVGLRGSLFPSGESDPRIPTGGDPGWGTSMAAVGMLHGSCLPNAGVLLLVMEQSQRQRDSVVEAQDCHAVFIPRPSTAVVLGWDPAQKTPPTPTKAQVRAAELGVSWEHRPAGRDLWVHPPYVWQEPSRTRPGPQGCRVSLVALAMGSPGVRSALEMGALRSTRKAAGAGAGVEGEMQTPTQASWQGAGGSFSSRIHFQRCCGKVQISI